jgi:hypothetical protein
MRPAAAALPFALALCTSCTTDQIGLLNSGIVSYRVTLKQPTELGTEDHPIDEPGPHEVLFDIEALGADGQVNEDYNATLKLWVFYLGTLSPVVDENGAATVDITWGAARDIRRSLPLAFGPTTIWIEDAQRDGADDNFTCLGPYAPASADARCTYATGASATIHYRYPFLDETQLPPDVTAPTATFQSQLDGKAVYVDRPRDLDSMLVVTAAYAQAFTVTDVSPSAMAIGYNHMYVYSYSRAKRTDFTAVLAGDVVVSCPGGVCSGYLSGGLKEFVGFTELDFPLFAVDPPVDTPPECRCGLSYKLDGSLCDTKVWAPCPEPALIDPGWLKGLGEPNYQSLEKLESGLVRVVNARVCRYDNPSWTKYGQFTVDIGAGCNLGVASKGVVNGLDPKAAEGQVLPEIIGTLRNVSDYSGGVPGNSVYNLWILYPRSAEDVDCGTATGCSK